MKASPLKAADQRQRSGDRSLEPATSEEGVDLALLEENLAKTVWERMLANDDALRLANMLRAAVLKKRGKS